MKKVNPILIFLTLLLGMIIFPFLPMELFHFSIDKLSSSMKILYSFTCDLGYMIIIFLVYKEKIIKEFKEYISNFKDNFKKSIKYYIIGFIIMVISNNLISIFFAEASANNEEAVRTLINIYPVYMIFSVSIYAPIVEETIFRRSFKDIFNSFDNNKYVKYLYISLSGLIFGAMHILGQASSNIDYLYVIPYASLGCAFAALYYKTDNLFSTIILHSLHNFVAVILFLWLGV